jgi:hypothetical protein
VCFAHLSLVVVHPFGHVSKGADDLVGQGGQGPGDHQFRPAQAPPACALAQTHAGVLLRPDMGQC